jgi:sugar lactone lactonase YvrE
MKLKPAFRIWCLICLSLTLSSCDLLLEAAIRAAGGSAKEITSFQFRASRNSGSGITDDCSGVISGTNITVIVPTGTDRGALIADFVTTGAITRVGSTGQVSGVTANDFTNPVIYEVAAADASINSYTVTVEESSESIKNLTSFVFTAALNGGAGVTTDCAGVIGGTSISVQVPYATTLTSLVATFTTTGAQVRVGSTAQVSGVTANDFTNPVIYEVIAADLSAKSYAVTVTVATAPKDLTSFVFTAALNGGAGVTTDCAGVIVGTSISVHVPYATTLTSLVATFATTGTEVKVSSAVQVSGVTANDFTNPVVYEVVAIDASTKGYIVTVINEAYAYIADASNHRIIRMDDMTGSGWLAFGTYGSGVNQFNNPSAVELDSSRRIYVVEFTGGRIVRMNDMSGTGWVSFGSSGSGINKFNSPHSIAFDSIGRIYIGDNLNNRIIRFDDMSGTNWVSFGAFGSGTNQFKGPAHIAIDADDKIYIADAGNGRIVRIDDMSGAGWVEFGSLGSGTNQFSGQSISLCNDGKLLIADRSNHRIIRIDDMTGAGWTVLSGYSGNTFSYPIDATMGVDGKIYIADQYHHRIVRVDDLTGAGWTTIGSGGSGDYQFGTASPNGVIQR